MNQHETMAWLLYEERVRNAEEQARLRRLMADADDDPVRWVRPRPILQERPVSRPVSRKATVEPA